MAYQVQWRRGTTANHTTFVGADGEITVDTSKYTLVVHDGVTPGGNPIERFPSQTGNSGKSLITNGTTFSWSNPLSQNTTHTPSATGGSASNVRAKLDKIVMVSDYSSVTNAINAARSNSWVLLDNSTDNITINVGSGGHVSTINAGIALAVKMRPLYKNGTSTAINGGLSVTLNLLSGFVMREEVNASNVDLGFITITSQDAHVVVDESYITGLAAFYGWNAVLPTINCIFQSNATVRTGTIDTGKIGYYLNGNSRGAVLSGKGFRNFTRWNLRANSGSSLTAEGAIANGNNISWRGLYANRASIVNAESISATNCYFGVVANGGSTVRADSSVTTGCTRGLFALCGGIISGVDANANNATEFGIYAFEKGVIDAQDATANNCTGGAAVYAFVGGSINFRGGTATNCSGNGIHAEQDSSINSDSADVSGAGNFGVYAHKASRINFANGDASSATTRGIYSNSGSTINAVNANGQKVGGSPSSLDIGVANGGIISAASSTGGLSQTANTLTSSGIIFK